MRDLFAELKRRQMFRVAAAYAVLAWLLLQIVINVAPVLLLPAWVARAFLLLLLIGFPVALFFAWMRELAPSDAPRAAASKLDYALIGVLALVIALIGYQELSPANDIAKAPPSTLPGSQPSSISIAVLPFANLSGDASQEFFSDGITEEITAALARVQGLTVLGRTSAFQFKGQNRDLRDIGQTLGATHLIEGSVRKEGDRVRITAQLVQAQNGANMWSESYDRQLTSVFATQEDIARAIAGALRVPLGLAPGVQLVSNRTADLDSYQQYLRARALFRSRDLDDVINILEPLVARDPNYAPAWALLAGAYLNAAFLEPEFREGSVEEARRVFRAALDKAETAAREAIRLDPSYGGGYGQLGRVERFRGNWVSADDLTQQSLRLDPNDPEILGFYAQRLATAGRIKDALRLSERLLGLEPFVPNFNLVTADILSMDGQHEAAMRMMEAMPVDGATNFARNAGLASAYAEAGRYAEAADTLLHITDQNQVSRQSVEEAARILRTAPVKIIAPETLPALGSLSFVYAHVGAFDRIWQTSERDGQLLPSTLFVQFWHRSYSPLRKTERFKTLVRNAGLVDYWRARGWPDLCRPVGADDFVCD